MNISTWRKIREILTPSQAQSALVLLVLMFVGMILETIGVGLVIPIIVLMTQDNPLAAYPYLAPVSVALGNPGPKTLIAYGMLALVGTNIVKVVFLAFLAWWQFRFAFGLQNYLSQKLFGNYLHKPYSFHLQRNSSTLIRNVTTEVGNFSFNVIIPAAQFLTECLVLLGLFGLLVTVEPLGAVIVAVVLGSATLLFHQCTKNRILGWGETRQLHEGLRIQHLQQGLGGAKEVKVFGRENEFLGLYREHNEKSVRAAQFHLTLQQLPRLWLELLASIGLALLVLVMISQGKELKAIVPVLGMFAATAFRLMPSVNRMLASVQMLRFSLPVVNILHQELVQSGEYAIAPESDHARRLPLSREVVYRNVTFAYPGAAKPALMNVSLTVKKGESVGFVGQSGSGKSTLVDVLLGLLKPQSGLVEVDGKDIHSDMRAWQNQIGYVPQVIFLTDDTLRRNVAFGLPDNQINEAALSKAIKSAQLEEFVAKLPDGLQTVVGERGVRLSGGQRQRIGIARALYHDPSVLVLDEATSALDMATEQEVMKGVYELSGQKTILIVAHRLTTLSKCDRIFNLNQGELEKASGPSSGA